MLRELLSENYTSHIVHFTSIQDVVYLTLFFSCIYRSGINNPWCMRYKKYLLI